MGVTVAVHQPFENEPVEADRQIRNAQIRARAPSQDRFTSRDLEVTLGCQLESLVDGGVLELGKHQPGRQVTYLIENTAYEIQDLGEGIPHLWGDIRPRRDQIAQTQLQEREKLNRTIMQVRTDLIQDALIQLAGFCPRIVGEEAEAIVSTDSSIALRRLSFRVRRCCSISCAPRLTTR